MSISGCLKAPIPPAQKSTTSYSEYLQNIKDRGNYLTVLENEKVKGVYQTESPIIRSNTFRFSVTRFFGTLGACQTGVVREGTPIDIV
jgi:hypothetical protein